MAEQEQPGYRLRLPWNWRLREARCAHRQIWIRPDPGPNTYEERLTCWCGKFSRLL